MLLSAWLALRPFPQWRKYTVPALAAFAIYIQINQMGRKRKRTDAATTSFADRLFTYFELQPITNHERERLHQAPRRGQGGHHGDEPGDL